MAIDEDDEDDVGMEIDESYSRKVSYIFLVTTSHIFFVCLFICVFFILHHSAFITILNFIIN